MTYTELLTGSSVHYPAIRMMISGILAVAPLSSIPTPAKYLSHESSSDMSFFLRITVIIWLIGSSIQLLLVYFFSFHLTNFVVIANLTISTIAALVVINCFVVVIARNAYVWPIKFGSKAYADLTLLDIEFMKLFLNGYGFFRPLPKDLYFGTIIDLVVSSKNLPELDRRLMTKEKHEVHPLTPSEIKEWEQQHIRDMQFTDIPKRARDLSYSTRWESFLLISSISIAGIYISYL